MDDSYAAGLIDGEGYVGIVSAGGSMQVRLKVSMTDKGLPAMRAMKQMYGGLVRPDRQATETNRETHTWSLNGQKAVTLLDRLMPHFLVKRDAVLVALDFQEMVNAADRLPNGKARWTPEMHEQSKMFRARIQEANRRGPDPTVELPSGMTPFARVRWGQLWEPGEGLFGPIEFTGKLPTSGRMVSGHLYEKLPTSGSSLLLPTPPSSDTNGAGIHALLPTPAVNDMGAGKTVDDWDDWTARMQAKHGNGNGHGKSLAIEAQRLLPTPSVADSMGGHLSRSGSRKDELLLPGVAKEIALRTGATTPPRSNAGSPSSDDESQHLPNPDATASPDSLPDLSSG